MNQTIAIRARDLITITNSQGKTISGWTWDGAALTHPLAKAPWTPVPAMRDRIETALAAIVPARTERLGGTAVSKLPESEQAGWEWDGRMDGNGAYVRTIPASYPASIAYVPADFGK